MNEINVLSYNLPRFRSICWTDDTEILENIDDTSSTTIAELQVPLKH